MNHPLRTSLINTYSNQIEENNNHIQNFMQLLNNQEQTLSRLIFENQSSTQPNRPNQQNHQNINYSPPPLFYNSNTLSENIRQSRNNQSNSLHHLNNQFLNIFRFPRLSRRNNNIPLENIDSIFEGFFDPINIIPTTEQIQNGIRICTYHEIENPHNTTCPISLTEFLPDSEVMMIRYCCHIFMKNELENWFQHNSRCPLCRYDIRNYNIRQSNM